MSGRPSVRLHDNFRKKSQIVVKFSAQFSLINISVEFEDENDPSRNSWAIEKIVIIDQTIPEGEYRDFFQKNVFSQSDLKHGWIHSVCKADSESDISFETNRSFLTKHRLKKVSKCAKTASRNQIAQICLRWPVVLRFLKSLVL